MTAFEVILIGGAVMVLIVILHGRRSRQLGRAEAQRDGFEKAADHAKEALEIDEDVARLSDAELDRELSGDTKSD